jgi:DNA-binding NarL/FixJ family response regulator
MTVTVYVVDDEALARRKIASLIAAVPWAKQIGEAADGVTAIDEISDLRPDIVFLDHTDAGGIRYRGRGATAFARPGAGRGVCERSLLKDGAAAVDRIEELANALPAPQ